MATNFTSDNISAIEIQGKKYNIKSISFHGTEAEWNASSYIPKAGEIIIYDADANNPVRYKIGDGTTNIDALPFATGTAVLYTSQALTNEQKEQARTNIGAISVADIPEVPVTSVAGKTGAVTLTKSDVGLDNVTNESKATMFASPVFTGIPTAPTAENTVDNTQVATTAFVHNVVGAISPADLGLEQAMKFLGTTTTDISDASNIDTIIVGNGTVKVEAGNVVLYNGYEYVWTGSAWEQLGQEGSFVLKSTTINGKALNNNITLTADDVDAYTKTEVDTALSSKSDTGHTHSLSDINEIEVTTSTETVYEKTGTAISNDGTDIGNFPYNKVNGKNTVVTFNGVEYNGEYSFEGGTYRLRFGDYAISQHVTDENAWLTPIMDGETYNLKVDVIEATTIIPEVYIPDRRNTWYASCRTDADINTKIVTTTSGNFRLEVGNVIYIIFAYPPAVNRNLNIYLKVDETEEIPVHIIGLTDTDAYLWSSYETVGFIYNGFNFEMIDSQIATTTYYGMTKLSSSTSSTATDVAATPSAVKEAYDLANSKADPSTTLAGYGITDAYTKTEVDTALDIKVDKVEGKGLSTNDYTTDEKNKLAGIAAGATANIGTITAVQANGVDIATSGVANIPIATTSAAGLMSATDKATFDSIPTTYATKAEVPTIEIVRW